MSDVEIIPYLKNRQDLVRTGPGFPSRIARPNRVVTFVTDQELQFLTQTAVEEDRSMASLLRRIIAARIKNN
jgi:hypothetical protein